MFKKNMTNQSEPGYNREGVFDNLRVSNHGVYKALFVGLEPQVSNHQMDTKMSFLLPRTRFMNELSQDT